MSVCVYLQYMLFVRMYVYVCMCVCACVWMYVCICRYVCMYACIYVRVHMCTCVCEYVCLSVSLYLFLCVMYLVNIHKHKPKPARSHDMRSFRISSGICSPPIHWLVSWTSVKLRRPSWEAATQVVPGTINWFSSIARPADDTIWLCQSLLKQNMLTASRSTWYREISTLMIGSELKPSLKNLMKLIFDSLVTNKKGQLSYSCT